jgi:hypothetical protein
MKIDSHAAQIAQNMQKQNQTPSQLARLRIEANAEFADSPFGKLVSSIAKGESTTALSSTPGSAMPA